MKKPFANVDRQLTCDRWSRSPNDLNLQNFILVEYECTIILKSTIVATKNGLFLFFSNQKPRGLNLACHKIGKG